MSASSRTDNVTKKGSGKQELTLAPVGGQRPPQEELGREHGPRLLDTPRTQEACKRLGLCLEDLQFRSEDTFAQPGDWKEKVQLRFEHHEKRRKARLTQVLAERAKVIAQNAKKGEVPGVQSFQFLSMLESVFEKESKFLENDLKSQLRHHGALVSENEEQIRRESLLRDKMAHQAKRRAASQQHFNDSGSRTRQRLDERQDRHAEQFARLEGDFRERQIAHARQMLAEEERLERFSAEKAQMSSDKSAVYKERVERIREHNQRRREDSRAEGEKSLLELASKIDRVHSRREEEQRRRQMISEEQHLHFTDVRAQKSRIDRVDGARREELRGQIVGNNERIEMLMALRDQLLDQRKGRNARAEATKGSRGLSLRRDCAPGPGHYDAPPSCLLEAPAAKIGKSRVPGVVEDAVRTTAKNPAPGAYDHDLLPNGKRVDKATEGSGKFNSRDRDTYLDVAIKAKDHVPAPDCYRMKSQLSQRGPELRPERVAEKARDKHDKRQFPLWARPGTETPGPSGYTVDAYARKEVLRRAQRSLPLLMRDMLSAARAH